MTTSTTTAQPETVLIERAPYQRGAREETAISRVAESVLMANARDLPDHDPYPDVLASVLHRETGFAHCLWKLAKERPRLFAKPARGWKRWTGYVLDGAPSRSRNDAVWWSEPVTWLSEWRAYDTHGQVKAIERAPYKPYDGPMVDRAVVSWAAASLHEANGVAGLTMDFGVLASGETALVEVNDGFSFGAYGNVGDTSVYRKCF